MRARVPGGWWTASIVAVATLTVVVLVLTLLGRLPGQGSDASAGGPSKSSQGPTTTPSGTTAAASLSFADGIISDGVMKLLFGPYPQAGRVSVRLHRPATGRTWRVTLTPAFNHSPPSPGASPKLLNRDIAYVQLSGFFPGAADVVLELISNLASGVKLRGLILDLRGNGGGDPAEVSRLLGAFTHGAAYAYSCDVHSNCAVRYTDKDVSLLHLPLVVLTDRNCVSACDAFSGAVKDLRLGTLVGTRTAGIVSGPADAYLLDDGSLLDLPATHDLGADHELINGIGVAPDYYLPLTAHDLSAGHDPDITKALTLLGG